MHRKESLSPIHSLVKNLFILTIQTTLCPSTHGRQLDTDKLFFSFSQFLLSTKNFQSKFKTIWFVFSLCELSNNSDTFTHEHLRLIVCFLSTLTASFDSTERSSTEEMERNHWTYGHVSQQQKCLEANKKNKLRLNVSKAPSNVISNSTAHQLLLDDKPDFTC